MGWGRFWKAWGRGLAEDTLWKNDTGLPAKDTAEAFEGLLSVRIWEGGFQNSEGVTTTHHHPEPVGAGFLLQALST